MDTYVVTLVHGTWARNAEWTKDSSPFCTQLKKTLGTDRVKLLEFKWSGRNSVRARLQAALELREHVSHASKEWPQARHFIVAHSHGGNVAMHALADSAVRKHVSGLVCLATPFIRYRERPLSLPLQIVPVVAFMLLSTFLSSQDTRVMVTVGVFVAAFALLGWQYFYGTIASAGWMGEQETIDYDNLPILTVRCVGDRVCAGLAAAQWSAWGVAGLWNLLSEIGTAMTSAPAVWKAWMERHFALALCWGADSAKLATASSHCGSARDVGPRNSPRLRYNGRDPEAGA